MRKSLLSLVRRALTLLGLLVLVGCGGGDDDAPAVDAGRVVDAMTPVDAHVCAPGACPCFSNHDCPADHTCMSQDPGGNQVYCVLGARGTGVKGTPCSGEADCASALCVDDAQGGMRCSDECTGPGDCPASLPRCLLIGFGVNKQICARQ